MNTLYKIVRRDNDNDNDGSFGSNEEYIIINTPLHIIDHGSVSYLALQQILLYDQQNVLLLLKNNNGQCDMNIYDDNDNTDRDITVGNDNTAFDTTFVNTAIVDEGTTPMTVKTHDNDYDATPALDVMVEPYDMTYDTTVSVSGTTTSYESLSTIIIKTTAFHESPSAIHDLLFISNADSNTGALAAPATADIMVQTIPYESNTNEMNPVITTSLSVTIADESTSSSVTVSMHDTAVITTKISYGSNTNTTLDTASNTTVPVADEATFPAGNDYSVTIMTATQVYLSPSSSISYYNDRESSTVSVAGEATISVLTMNTTFDTTFDTDSSSSATYDDDYSAAVKIITTVFDGHTSDNHDYFGRISKDANSFGGTSDNNCSFGRVTTTLTTPFHIIDHGSVVYLVHLQIRFYDQQDSLSLLENNSTSLENNNGECDMNNTDEMTRCVMKVISSAAIADGAQYDYYYGDAAVSIASSSIVAVSIASPSIAIDTESSPVSAGNNSPVAVTMKTYDMPSAIRDGIISAVNDEDSSAFTIVTTAIIMMTTAFHESPSVIHIEIPSAAVADEATFTPVTNMTTVFDGRR